ncbi:MAG: LPXTG cell wall anchor domain-containing protein, partial [Actinobacteria bacterium]|nr:LPXTG cell wall anchor domain-containing protein [Actinomycetota bacterium]
TGADHSVATATTVTDLVEAGALPYTGSNSGTLALVGAGLALGGLMLVSATGMIATRRRND